MSGDEPLPEAWKYVSVSLMILDLVPYIHGWFFRFLFIHRPTFGIWARRISDLYRQWQEQVLPGLYNALLRLAGPARPVFALLDLFVRRPEQH